MPEFLIRKGVTLDQLADALKEHFRGRYEVWTYDHMGLKWVWVKKNANSAALVDFSDRSRITGSKLPEGPEVQLHPRRPPGIVTFLLGIAAWFPPLNRGSLGVVKDVGAFLASGTTLLRDSQPPPKPLDQKRVQDLVARFDSKSTDELKTAVAANNTGQWVPEALEAMRRVLEGRQQRSP